MRGRLRFILTSLQRVLLLGRSVGGVGRSGRCVVLIYCVCVCVSVYERACLLRVYMCGLRVNRQNQRPSRPARASEKRRQAGREAARERSASKAYVTLREMVTSTPGILLLPLLIYLQHCINVHGKSAVSVYLLSVFFFFFPCVCVGTRSVYAGVS